MAFPSAQATKTYLDQTTDSPANARSELAALVDLVNQMITSYAQASGICDLDATGQIPVARLPGGSGGGLDADTLDGQEGSFYRSASNLNAGTLPSARFNDTAHGSRSGGTLHAAATTSVRGFVELSTNTEAGAKSDPGRVITPANLGYLFPNFVASSSGEILYDSGLFSVNYDPFQMYREVICTAPGSLYSQLSMTDNLSGSINGQIYVNGVAYSPSHNVQETTTVFNDTITGLNRGDRVQLYCGHTNTNGTVNYWRLRSSAVNVLVPSM